jgi:large subunit ribosomal protein L10
MENPRPEKVAVVQEVRERLEAAAGAILTEYRGLTVKELAVLRGSLRDAGGEYKIYKNTLVRFAVRDLGLDDLEPALAGPTAIAFVEGDAVTVARALRDFSRTNPNLVFKAGLLGRTVLSAADATALADVPPRDVLLARVAGGLAAPMSQFASLLQAVVAKFAYSLQALIDKSGGVQEVAAPTGVEDAVTGPGPAPVGDAADAAAEPPAEAPAPEPPTAEAPAEPPTAEAPAADQTDTDAG